MIKRSWAGAVLCLNLAMLMHGQAIAQDSDLTAHMQEHMQRISQIKTAVIRGDLDGLRRPAAWLAQHEPSPEASILYVPFILSMRGHASEILEAQDANEAAGDVSVIATDCANCHIASEIVIDFGNAADPPAWSDMESHMQRHQWAIDRLWEGLIGPSDASWSRGIRMLAEAPLHGTEAVWDGSVTGGDEMARRVHELGREAATALLPHARAAVYGEMLGVCADCHTRTGGGLSQ